MCRSAEENSPGGGRDEQLNGQARQDGGEAENDRAAGGFSDGRGGLTLMVLHGGDDQIGLKAADSQPLGATDELLAVGIAKEPGIQLAGNLGCETGGAIRSWGGCNRAGIRAFRIVPLG